MVTTTDVKLQGTTLTTALGFVEKDLALQRAKGHVGRAPGGANVSTAEAWLEDMLELIVVDGGEPVASAAEKGLTRARIDQNQLYADGLDANQAAQLSCASLSTALASIRISRSCSDR